MLRKYERQLLSAEIDISEISPVLTESEFPAWTPAPLPIQAQGFVETVKPKALKRVINEGGGYYRVTFPYSADLVSAIKALPWKCREWVGDGKYWLVNFKADNSETKAGAISFLGLIKREGFQVDESILKAFGQISDQEQAKEKQKAENLSMATATEAEIAIPNMKGTLKPFQAAGVRYALKNKRVFIADEMGLGKLQPLDSKVLTPEGFVEMGDIRIGSQVVGKNGEPTNVTGVYPNGIMPIYRVSFSDGSSTECGLDHLWAVESLANGHRDGWRIKTLRELLKNGLKSKAGNRKWKVPLVDPVQHSSKKFPINSYILGVLIGDGALSGSSITWSTPDIDKQIVELVSQRLPQDVSITENRSSSCPRYRIKGNDYRKNSILRAIKDLNLDCLSTEKFIPEKYFLGDQFQRWELLFGLMDTDGSCSNNRTTFSTKSRQLAIDIQRLVWSLGGVSNIREYDRSSEEKGIEFQVNIKTHKCPFLIKRKSKNWRLPSRNKAIRTIESAEYIGEKEAQCIKVDAADCLYVTDDYIVTHNTPQSLATLEASGAFPALVICRANLRLNWRREIAKFFPHRSVSISPFDKSSNIVIVSHYDLVKGCDDLCARRFKTLIADECQDLKSQKSQRTKAAKRITKESRPEYRMLLSGTPLENRPSELISQLEILGQLEEFGGFMKFAYRYCGAFKGNFGLEMGGATNTIDLHSKLMQNCYIRRLKADVLKELPDKTRDSIEVEISNRSDYNRVESEVLKSMARLKAEFREKRADIEAQLKGMDQEQKINWIEKNWEKTSAQTLLNLRKGKIKVDSWIASKLSQHEGFIEGSQKIVLMGRLMESAALGKIEAFKEWYDSFEGQKIVVYARSRKVQEALAAAFPSFIYTRDSKWKQTQDAVDAFANTDAPGIICSLMGDNAGLNGMQCAQYGVFIDMDFVPARHLQGEDRLHRIGQKGSVNWYYFHGANTIDQDTWDLLQGKLSVMKAVLDGEDSQKEESNISGELFDRLQKRS